MGDSNLYKNIINHTSQFPMCGNPFRADTYRGCTHGCCYCFAKYMPQNEHQYVNEDGSKGYESNIQVGDVSLFERWIRQAITENNTSNIRLELLNRRVPLHLGGLSDPFQPLEFKARAQQ